ncbi:MAG TPA: serine/threonine-protein kinase [Polyangia bacterium]|nr:serine/threonine-protein kinase [Polyangia bacterium]
MITQNTKNVLVPANGHRARIGRYQLLDCLATGGMAQVFLALSGELSGFRTLVVVKRILPHLSLNRHFIRMFFDEARLAAQLDHPNVVRIIEVGQDGDEYFLAMEAVQGRSLSSLLRRGCKQDKPLTHAQSAFIIAQAANGLGYAHDLADTDGRPLEVVHRDVSPQNILISFEGSVKVIDFGVARALGRISETRAGGVKGKVHYMSPEQASGGEVDRRSDVFALGIVLWEALCGQRLFRRDNERAALHAIVDDPIKAPSEVVRISPRLERIVMKALEKDPADRYKTAEEMALALERHAFTTEGFNPTQVGTAMKTLFASDHARWKKTIAAARDLEGEPEQWTNTSGTFLRPQDIDLHTRGSTVVLRPGRPTPISSPSTSVTSHDTPSPNRAARTAEQTQVPAPALARTDSSWIGGLGLLIVAGVVGVLALSPLPTMTTIRILANRLSPPRVEALPRPPTVEPLPRVVHAAVVPPAPSAAQAQAVAIAPGPPEVPVPVPVARAEDRPSVPEPSPRQEPSAHINEGAPAPEPAPPAALDQARQPPRAPKKLGHALAPPPPPASPRPAAANATRVTAASGLCSITVGTRPWSEIWIDGHKTPHHTPYTDNISCGRHELTFKRNDLAMAKSYIVTVYPGEPFKQSFPLQ